MFDRKIKKRTRKERTIEQLRRFVPGEWRYEFPSRWIHETGVVVQSWCGISISENGCETYYSYMTRSDTKQRVYLELGIGLEAPFVKDEEPPPWPRTKQKRV